MDSSLLDVGDSNRPKGEIKEIEKLMFDSYGAKFAPFPIVLI